MTIQEYMVQYNTKPEWELNAIKKALSIMEILNTPDENNRLNAVKMILKNRRA